MLKLCEMKKAVTFLYVLRFGRVRMDAGNWFQSRVPFSRDKEKHIIRHFGENDFLKKTRCLLH